MYRFVAQLPTVLDGRSLVLGADFGQVFVESSAKPRGVDPLFSLYPDFRAFRSDGSLGNKDPDAMLQGYRMSANGLNTDIFASLNTNMTVAEVYLYTNTVNDVATATETDVSDQLAPSGGTVTHLVGAPNVTTFFWLKTVDGSGNETISNLGSRATQDLTPPTISSATMVLDPDTPAQKIDLAWTATDNDAIQAFYVLISETASTQPSNADIKSLGVSLPGNSTGGDVGGLEPGTQYYGWLLARDQVGNETVTAFNPASITTDPDVTAPTLDSFTLSATSGSEETAIDVTVTISDVVG